MNDKATGKVSDAASEVINIVGIPVGWAILAFIAGALLVAGFVYVLGTRSILTNADDEPTGD